MNDQVREIDNVKQKIVEVEKEIQEMAIQILHCKDDAKGASLREEKRQLREEKRQLREEKLLLLAHEDHLLGEEIKLVKGAKLESSRKAGLLPATERASTGKSFSL